MNVGVVSPKVQRPAVGRQPSSPARIHEDTGVPTQLACMQFALVHVTSVDDGAAYIELSAVKKLLTHSLYLAVRVYFCCSNYSSPVKKLAKKRKVVIDDDDDNNAVAEAEREQRHKADDSLEIASLNNDSDNDEVCKVMYVAASNISNFTLCVKFALLPSPCPYDCCK